MHYSQNRSMACQCFYKISTCEGPLLVPQLSYHTETQTQYGDICNNVMFLLGCVGVSVSAL